MLTSMNRLPLHTLPTFRAVAQTCNLRAAAQALHLTHSAVSQQIRVLEEQLGFQLFERRGRRVVLNAAGRCLLPSVEAALAQLETGVQAAATAVARTDRPLRLTVLPSFAQRWLLPRLARWRERHPDIALEVEVSHRIVDLQREGFHAAVRIGRGQWPGVQAEKMMESPWIAVAVPATAQRLQGRGIAALLDEPLIGDAPLWEEWFAGVGLKARVRPVASFNDMGLMLQAAEHNLGITLARELFAVDALADGRLVRLSPMAVYAEGPSPYYFAYPVGLADWAPVQALRRWLFDELALARQQLDALGRGGAPLPAPTAPAAGRVRPGPAKGPAARETAPAGRKENRTRAPSATRARGPGP
jgi:LysR family glycine cleavage system transcriptional activator